MPSSPPEQGKQRRRQRRAISILRELEITIVGDFIVSPDCDEDRFDALERYVSGRKIDLPSWRS